ncbi:MAG: carbohydrate-binding family 9-like protein, partial [Myxococcales bacterium]|nr:carbohydrate-binding family 9-like protein [Myxococcales bacterium]
YKKHDDHLWQADCVEAMFDPTADGKNYFELQVSPRGTSFDTRYVSRRVPRPFGHTEWESGIEAQVQTRGTVDDGDEDEGYTVEARIPWKAFQAGIPPVEAPKAGATWRANFYVMDAREGGMRAAGWSPPLVGDFHVPKRFGVLRFRGEGEGDAFSKPAPKTTEGDAPEGPPGQVPSAPDLQGAKKNPRSPHADDDEELEDEPDQDRDEEDEP